MMFLRPIVFTYLWLSLLINFAESAVHPSPAVVVVVDLAPVVAQRHPRVHISGHSPLGHTVGDRTLAQARSPQPGRRAGPK
jgi:hypothetical protein